MKLKFIIIFLTTFLTVPIYTIESVLEIPRQDITQQQFWQVYSKRKFKFAKEDGQIFNLKPWRPNIDLQPLRESKKVRVVTSNIGLSGCKEVEHIVDSTTMHFSGDEYWLKYFPLFKKSCSLKLYQLPSSRSSELNKNEWLMFAKNDDFTQEKSVHSLVKTSIITRTPNPYGWAALSGTVLTIAAAATYGYLKLFKTDTK